MTGACHDHAILVEFLHALAGDAPAQHYVELRYVLPEHEGMGQVFEHPRRIGELATRALHLGRRTDVYVGCAPRAERSGGRDAVTGGFALWADCDDPESSAALRSFKPRPSIVIESGIIRSGWLGFGRGRANRCRRHVASRPELACSGWSR